MKHLLVVGLSVLSFTLLQSASGQGFVNLNFEQATITPTPIEGSAYPADPAQLFPGWTVGGIGTVVSYNDLSVGSPAVDLMGPNFPNAVHYSPLQGSYSVLLQYFGGADMGFQPPTLSQTGVIPANAQSINFLVGQSDAFVSLNGTAIPLVSIAGGRMAGDISAFAGSTAQLTFSTTSTPYPGNWVYFDDVKFSTTAVPEPTTLSLFGMGLLFLGWRFKRRHQ